MQPFGCSPPGSSVHGIFQARTVECPPPGNLPNTGIEPGTPVSPALWVDSLSAVPSKSPNSLVYFSNQWPPGRMEDCGGMVWKKKKRKGKRKKRNREKKFVSKTITLYFFFPTRSMFIKLKSGVIIWGFAHVSLLSFIIEMLLTFLGHLKMSLIYFHLFWIWYQ